MSATQTIQKPQASSAATSELSRREMYAKIRALCTPDNTTNLWVLVREWGVYALLVAGCLFGYHAMVDAGWSRWWGLLLYIPTIIAIALWPQTRLACLVHESSHYLLFKNRVLNDILANLFVVFPFFGSVSNYRKGHWGHHRHVNDPENDPDLKRLKKHHRRDFPISKRRVFLEYVVLQLAPHKVFTYLKGRAEYVMFLMDGEKVANQQPLPRWALASLRIGFYLTLFGTITYFGWWTEFLLFWAVPLLTFYPASLFLREIAHHGNYPDNGDFTNSRVYEGWWLEREILFPFGEWNHVLHHMFPTIPWHKTRAAHNVMMQYPPYRDHVVICDGFFFKGPMGDEYPTVVDVLAKPSHYYLRGRGQSDEATGEIRSSTADEVGAVQVKTGVLLGGES